MATVVSVATEGPQIDGRRWIAEVLADALGRRYERRYLAPANFDANAAAANRAAALDAELRDIEIAANVAEVLARGSEAVVSTDYSTNAQNLAGLREAYRTATRLEAVMIGDFLAGLTDAQLRSIFGMTSAQVTTLRTNRLTPAAQAAAAIRSAVGQ